MPNDSYFNILLVFYRVNDRLVLSVSGGLTYFRVVGSCVISGGSAAEHIDVISNINAPVNGTVVFAFAEYL